MPKITPRTKATKQEQLTEELQGEFAFKNEVLALRWADNLIVRPNYGSHPGLYENVWFFRQNASGLISMCAIVECQTPESLVVEVQERKAKSVLSPFLMKRRKVSPCKH